MRTSEAKLQDVTLSSFSDALKGDDTIIILKKYKAVDHLAFY